MFGFLLETLIYVVNLFIRNAPILIFGLLIAAAARVYLDPEKLKRTLTKKSGASIFGSVAFGALTPFCACGTMAVVVAMMTTMLPLGPIMAFLTSSPIMGPEEFVIFAGVVNFRFAVALTITSMAIGVLSGYITHIIDKKTKFLKNQIRAIDTTATTCCHEKAKVSTTVCCSENKVSTCGCDEDSNKNADSDKTKNKLKQLFVKHRIAEFSRSFYSLGFKRVLPFFALFAAIGFMISQLVPSEIITNYLGADNHFAVPLLSLMGLPFYVGAASGAPLLYTLIEAGASQGAVLSFMVTGSGTSIAVIAGLLLIMRKRAILLYLAFLISFGILAGYIFDLYLFLT